MPPPPPHPAALLSLPALEALKREQLVKLAKHFDLKANGKVSGPAACWVAQQLNLWGSEIAWPDVNQRG